MALIEHLVIAGGFSFSQSRIKTVEHMLEIEMPSTTN
jgi:hypothetical protein